MTLSFVHKFGFFFCVYTYFISFFSLPTPGDEIDQYVVFEQFGKMSIHEPGTPLPIHEPGTPLSIHEPGTPLSIHEPGTPLSVFPVSLTLTDEEVYATKDKTSGQTVIQV